MSGTPRHTHSALRATTLACTLLAGACGGGDHGGADAAVDQAAPGQEDLLATQSDLSSPSGAEDMLVEQGGLTFSSSAIAITSPYAAGQSYYAQAGLKVTNVTTSAIAVTGISTGNADFSQTSTCGASIAAGASCVVVLKFQPGSAGPAPETATLSFAAATGTTQIALTGTATAGVMITALDGCAPDDAGGTPQGNCIKALSDATTAAGTFYASCSTNGNTSPYTISIPAGTYDISAAMTAETTVVQPILLDGITACGAFLIEGAGSSLTTLVTNNAIEPIHGTKVNNTTIQGMTLSRNDAYGFHGSSITQGSVQSVAPDNTSFTVNIPNGFPSPAQLLTWYMTGANYIKPFTNTAKPVVYNTADTQRLQMAASNPASCSGTNPVSCTITLASAMSDAQKAIYLSPSYIACFKMETAKAYFFDSTALTDGNGNYTASHVGFDDIVWIDSSRGAFRGINNAFVTNSAIRRRPAVDGQYGCTASWSGGPQFGQPGDNPITGVTVTNFYSEGTADNTIEIFESDTTTSLLKNITIENGFGEFLSLYQSCNVSYSWAALMPTLKNCPTYQNNGTLSIPTSYGGCITDDSPTECSPPLDQISGHQ